MQSTTMRSEGNLFLGIIGAVLGAIAGAFCWAAVSIATHYNIGFVAIAIGWFVGYGNRTLGKGHSRRFAIVGAIFAGLGCLFGNLLYVASLVVSKDGITIVQLLSRLDLWLFIRLAFDGFDAMDVLFYGLAIYWGYRYSISKT